MADTGNLQVQVYERNTFIPVPNAKVTISNTNEEENTGLEPTTLITDTEGRTMVVQVETPSIDRSLNKENTEIPYALVNIKIVAEGYADLLIKGVQVLPFEKAIQIANLIKSPLSRETTEPNVELEEVINIPPNVQYGKYPPKIPEDPEKPLPPPPSGLVVLPEPVVPEYIIVHAGSPTDTSAPNYKVSYTDYLKNVASSEIYATWPNSTIRANVYVINSFALNRIYTEWYRSKGYDFDITNSTAYDQAFVYGRNIFESISVVVDELFSTYVKREGAKQPLLTQYCDGKYVQCPEWMTQWGSKDLGEQGYTPYEILTYYYGNDIVLDTAPKVSGSPKSYPGYVLKVGSKGEPVKTIQTFLNRVAKNYPLIGKVPVDGVYGPSTEQQVKLFQQTFNLPQTGQVDYATWYKISAIYTGVTRIAELKGADIGEVRESMVKEEYEYFIPPVPCTEIDDIPKVKYRVK